MSFSSIKRNLEAILERVIDQNNKFMDNAQDGSKLVSKFCQNRLDYKNRNTLAGDSISLMNDDALDSILEKLYNITLKAALLKDQTKQLIDENIRIFGFQRIQTEKITALSAIEFASKMNEIVNGMIYQYGLLKDVVENLRNEHIDSEIATNYVSIWMQCPYIIDNHSIL